MSLAAIIEAALLLTGHAVQDLIWVPGARRARCYVRTRERAGKGYDHWAHVFSVPRGDAGVTTRRTEP